MHRMLQPGRRRCHLPHAIGRPDSKPSYKHNEAIKRSSSQSRRTSRQNTKCQRARRAYPVPVSEAGMRLQRGRLACRQTCAR